LAVLASETVHYSLSRVIRMMGWGEGGLVVVPVDECHRLKAEALPEALARAKAQGRHVIGVIGNGCCTATGAFDPLPQMADFCEANGLWFHVDGAHGASAVLSARYKHLAQGIERADSVIWDPHKMMMMPALVTAVLYKKAANQYQTFAQEASYLFAADDPRAMDEPFNLAHRSLECTKKMMGFKLYATLMCYGEELFDDYLTQTFDLARCLYEKLQAHPQFEALMAPESNIVCFRLIPPGVSEAALDPLQAQVRETVVQGGRFYLVKTQLNGRLYLRTTLMNPFTTAADFDTLLETLVQASAG
jgi:L-2,4-diaminobutyrate decarboxylase